LDEGAFADVCFVTNTRGWVFEAVHQQYTIAFTIVRRGGEERDVAFAGPFHSRDEFEHGRDAKFVVSAEEFGTWTGAAAFPLIPDPAAGEVFRQMRVEPELRDGSFRPVIELRPVEDRSRIHTDLANPFGPIPILTGRSINIWNPDFGDPYGYASEAVFEHLLAKTRRSSELARSPFHGLTISSIEELPCSRPRIAFRDVCRPNDTRTCIAALIPPRVAVMHSCPYLLRTDGDERDEAFILGVMSSVPFDWYARRTVELHLTFDLLGSMPIPQTRRAEPRHSRVVEIAGRLAARDDRYADWATAVGVPVGSAKNLEEQVELVDELDGLVASLYGLSRDQLEHIFATFHRGWDFGPRLESVLRYFDALEGDV
jgi:hypothetical protein